MAGFKNCKIMLPIKEFLIVKGQATYELNTIDMTKVTVFYRKYNQEAFLETYSEMPKGDYRINEVGGNKQLEITNLDILDEYYSIQLARVVDLTSSPYNPSGQIDVITLNQHLNEVIADVTFLFTYLKDVGMVMDSSNGNKIMAELKPYTTWYMDKDGNMAAMPVDSLFEKFNDLVQELRQEVLKLLEQDLEVAERELLEEVKRQLDEYVETDLKQRLDDYTTQLEERLQTMIDQAVADKGLMPEGSDWLEIGLGNWLVVDLFNKNYIHYPPQLNSSDNAGVVKKDITDGGNSQVIRFYTTTGKMLFIVRVNEVWSEWQELGEQTDTMQFTQPNHEFVFTAVTLDGATRKWVKANKYTSADGIAIKIDNDRFDVVTRGVVNIPTSARDDKGEPFVYDEYYFLSQEVDGGLSRTKNEIGTFQYLAHISEIDNKQVAYIDIGDSYDLDYEVVDTETADRVGIGTYKTTLRTADTIEDLKRLNLKEGDAVEVLGYYTKGDGANHKRKIESSDDGSGILLNNGLYANIVHNGEVNVSWFGAINDVYYDSDTALFKTPSGIDNSTIIEKALNNPNIKTVFITKDYGINKPIVCTRGGIIIKGGGRIIKLDDTKTGLGVVNLDEHGGTFDLNISTPILFISVTSGTISYVFDIDVKEIEIRCNFNTTPYGAITIPLGSRINLDVVTAWTGRGLCGNDIFMSNIKITGYNLKGALIYFVQGSGSNSGNGTSNLFNHCYCVGSTNTYGDPAVYCYIGGQAYTMFQTCACDSAKNFKALFRIDNSDVSIISCGNEWFKGDYLFYIQNSRVSITDVNSWKWELMSQASMVARINSSKVIMNNVLTKDIVFGDITEKYFALLEMESYLTAIECDTSISRKTSIQQAPSKIVYIDNGEITYQDNTTSFLDKRKKYLNDDNKDIVAELSSPAMLYAMELEGGTVKQDYLEYSLEKFKYDKQLEAEEKAKQEAYQQALINNPNLTYEEFITSYPMMLPNIEEPTIPQSVQEFMKKYL